MSNSEEQIPSRLSIDELASSTGVSTRTIRYYQARALLPKPEREGRVAYYEEAHAVRLKMIEELKSRGLTLRAIKDLVRHAGTDNQPLEAWLELDRLRGTWTSEAPASYTRSEIEEALGVKDVSTLNRLVESDVIQIEGGPGARRYRAEVPSLVRHAIELEGAGISLELSSELHSILQRNFVTAVREAIRLLDSNRGCGFGKSAEPEDIEKAIRAIMPAPGATVIRQVFGQATEIAMAEWLEDRAPRELGRRQRRRSSQSSSD